MGKVVGLFTAADQGAPMERHEHVMLAAGRGIVGDRYAESKGFWTPIRPGTIRNVTIISALGIARANEELRGLGHQAFQPEQTRRNIVVDFDPDTLNTLVGQLFTLGEIRFIGAELAKPCLRPVQLLGRKEKGYPIAFKDCGGIRAEVMNDGVLRLGDESLDV